ncbi:MAG: STAS domain-containing protein [Rectinemataceae bacterium]
MASNLLARAQKAQAAFRNPAPDSGTADTAVVLVAPGVVALPVGGILDISRLDAMESVLTDAAANAGTGLILDISGLDALDAAGVGFFAAFHKRMRSKGSELVLAGMRPRVLEFILILGFESYFTVAIDASGAIDYFRNAERASMPSDARCPACGAGIASGAVGRRRCRACKAVLSTGPDGTPVLG